MFPPEAFAIRRSVWSNVKSKAGASPQSVCASALKSVPQSILRGPTTSDTPMAMLLVNLSVLLNKGGL
ncbi:MAG: hypothetical protein CMK53_00555 [Proteobacteria bacterium]|nr:hypothetical protein [Deltaproteobacteria bacterium]MAD99102.1 hypothetical protein [Pseudomonadota bacterium]MBP44276.1 hypothetical protein [Deltaproteobacteria bacterium]